MSASPASARAARRGREMGPPAVLLDMDFQGLAIARCLGRRGISVFAVDSRPRRWTLACRYCAPVACPRLEAGAGPVLGVLMRLGEELGPGSVLFPLHDGYLGLMAEHREELDRWFRAPTPRSELLRALTDKRRLAELLRQAGAPMPETHVPGGEADLEAVGRAIAYPCLIKPASNRQWGRGDAPAFVRGRKALKVESREELLALYRALPEGQRELIVQEVIPGPEERLYYCVAYLDARSRPLGMFVGRKLRTAPMGFGAGTFVESVEAPEVMSLSAELLARIGYCGNVGVEWKLDPRDGRLKVIEINARYGLWDGFGAHCGIDFAYLAYSDLTGRRPPRANGYRTGQRWLNLSQDVGAALAQIRAGRLTWGQWLRSLATARAHASFAWDDPAPFVRHYGELAAALGRQARARLARRTEKG